MVFYSVVSVLTRSVSCIKITRSVFAVFGAYICLIHCYLLCLFLLFLLIIVPFLENATIGYSLESLCVCVCVCMCFCMITQKEIDLGTRNRNSL